MTKFLYCLQAFCSHFLGNPMNTIVSPLLWVIQSEPHTCSWPCLVPRLSWVEDTNLWDNVLHWQESKLMNSVGFWCILRVVFCLQRQESKLVNILSASVAQRDVSGGLKTSCRARQIPTEFTHFDSSQWRTLSHL